MAAEHVIARSPPQDGRNWHDQCARCGSSTTFVDCDHCGGEGLTGHDCGDDSCCCLYSEDNVRCDICRGAGGWRVCLSSEEWCEAHPSLGRSGIPRGAIEWFTFDPAPDSVEH